MIRNCLVAIICGLVMSAALEHPAWSQEPTNTSIAVLDVQQIMRESMAATSVRTQTEQHRAKFQAEITQQENGLRAAEQELLQQQTILTPEAFNERRREFELNVADLSQLVQTRKRQVNAAFGGAMQNVQEVLLQIVEELMAENGVSVVLPRSVVFLSKGMNLTAEALKRLDERLPSVEVVLPAE